MIFVSHTTGTASRWATPAAGQSRAVNLQSGGRWEQVSGAASLCWGGTFKRYKNIAGKMLAIVSALTQLHHHMNSWSPFSRHSPSSIEFDYLLFVVCLLVCNLFCSCVYMWWVHSPSVIDWLLSLFVKSCVWLCTCGGGLYRMWCVDCKSLLNSSFKMVF